MVTIKQITDLRSRAATIDSVVVVLGKTTMNDGYGDTFYWDSTDSSSVDNGLTIIQVTGMATGRWKRLKTLSVRAGNYLANGSATTNYVVAHGLGVIPSIIVFTPVSINAAAPAYVSARDATNFTITFLSLPVIGTNNISFDWLVRA